MLNALIFDRFLDSFPLFDFGKIWSRFKVNDEPTRPAFKAREARRPILVAYDPNNPRPDSVVGMVHVTTDGRVIFRPVQFKNGEQALAEAYYVGNPPDKIFSPEFKDLIDFDSVKTRDERNSLSVEDKRLLIHYLYKEADRPAALARLTLG
jgi:hypothetical protein